MSALEKKHRNPTQHISRRDCILFVVFYKFISSMATAGCSLRAHFQVMILPCVTISIFTVLLNNPIFVGILFSPLGHENTEAPRKYSEEHARKRHGVTGNLLDVCAGSSKSTTRAANVGVGAVRLQITSLNRVISVQGECTGRMLSIPF